MRIVVDARKATDYGIGTYIRRLGKACAALSPDDEFVFLGSPRAVARFKAAATEGRADLDPELPSGDNVTWHTNSSANYGIAELISVSRQVRKLRGDVFHAPHYVYPVALPCPGVVTIHDCIHLRFPGQLPSPLAALYARAMMYRAVRASRRVLTVSEATKADLVELVNADPARVEVIPHGCDPFYLEQVADDELEEIGSRYSLDRPFLLTVSNIKPHKNLRRLLEAFGHLGSSYRDLDLVIVGGRVDEHPELAELCGQRGIGDRVRSLGFVPKGDLRGLYHLARLFVFPSLYEGFGLPPLEAMACGAPVVGSRSSAIPEVVGRSGLLVNPYRVDAIAEAIRSLLENSSFRSALGAQGRRRAAEFDWDRSARRVLEIYREVAAL